MFFPCLESQDCHLIPLSYLLSFFFCLVFLLFLFCQFSANSPFTWFWGIFFLQKTQIFFVKGFSRSSVCLPRGSSFGCSKNPHFLFILFRQGCQIVLFLFSWFQVERWRVDAFLDLNEEKSETPKLLLPRRFVSLERARLSQTSGLSTAWYVPFGSPKGGRWCLILSLCLESQGCNLIPLSYLLSCFSA